MHKARSQEFRQYRFCMYSWSNRARTGSGICYICTAPRPTSVLVTIPRKHRGADLVPETCGVQEDEYQRSEVFLIR